MQRTLEKNRGYWESFDDIDGLGHECTCLMEDKNGNIWIGTNTGMTKYDGRKFISLTRRDGLVSNDIRCMYQDRAGNFWVGTRYGLSRYDGKDFINFTNRDGLPGNEVDSILQDNEGNIWIGTNKGLCKYNGNEFTVLTVDNGLPGNEIHSMRLDREGNIWIGTLAKGISKFDGEKFFNLSKEDGLAGNDVHCIIQDREGCIWIGTERGLSLYDCKRFANYRREHHLPGEYIHCIYEDNEGHIWLGILGGGVCYYDGNSFVTLNTEHGLANNDVFDIIQDREGSLWFACYHGGISRYNPYEISSISEESVGEVIIQDKNSHIWWGSRNTLSKFDGKDVIHYPYEHTVFELLEDSKGRFWVGTDGGGLFRYDNPDDIEIGNARIFTMNEGLINNRVVKLFEDTQGNIWIGTRGGLSRYDDKGFSNFTMRDGLRCVVISVIRQDKNGNLLFAGWAGAGITAYDGDKFSVYPDDNTLVGNEMICLIVNGNNDLWMGTPSGLIHYDGNQTINYTSEDGLLGGFIQRMIRDSRGQLWIATLGGGISRFDGKNFQSLTTEDGLPSNSVTGIIESHDESMIISTYRGICRYVPNFKIPPLVSIDEVDADRIYKEPTEIQILENVPSVRIMYHGMSFKTKKMRYNYILEGYDKDWKATWDEQVRYEDLPAGEYTFKVIAINRDMVYSEKPAELKIKVVSDTRDQVISELEKKVRERTEELRRHRDHLEELVQQRTMELTRTVRQLQQEIVERERVEELTRSQQQQLVQADKMATLGILASGIAHEINNPNNFILLNARIFSKVWNDVLPILEEYHENQGDFAIAGMPYTQVCERIGQLINGISEGSQRIQKIVQGLRDFARHDTGNLNQLVNINTVADAAILIVSNLIQKSTRLFSCEYDNDIPNVLGNAQQLEQVIINLLTNACQALPDRDKRLFISTSHDNTSNNVIVCIRDEGVGIPPENLKHILDPFFTTKRDTGGTGLGLSISYNIIKTHGGELIFDSESGKGTTVTIKLKAHQNSVMSNQ